MHNTNNNSSVQRRLKVLVVNVFFDDWRSNTRSPLKIPQALAPFHLAGVLCRQHCEVRVYNEHHSGPLTTRDLLEWPDVLVLTGLNVAFDRMLHLTAYARTYNSSLVVVAGGHAVRALPIRAAQYFDYICKGDVEELGEVIAAAFGQKHVAEQISPRYDLMNSNSWLGYLESSRNCNFNCSFCTMTGEANSFYKYALEDLERHIREIGRKRHLLFLDNNFFGGGPHFFKARMELLRTLYRAGQFGGWSAMVTADFFIDENNLTLAREAGCQALFSGIESFDDSILQQVNKKQNLVLPQFEIVNRCLDAGIMFHYGMIFDIANRSVSDFRAELELLFENPQVPLPSFLSLTIPLLGTPYFQECVEAGVILPRTRLRDMDGFTLTMQPKDSLPEAVEFVKALPTLRGYRRKVFSKTLNVLRKNFRNMNRFQLLLTASNGFLLCAPNVVNAPFRSQQNAVERTWISSTEHLDPLYEPQFPVAEQYRSHFTPTLVTDDDGSLSKDMLLDYNVNGSRVTSVTAKISKKPAIA
jgi:radical SAM superfamily enzyme YgiQ (UPF0313 family)